MKQFFKIFLVVGVIAFFSTSAMTGCSCGKKPSDKNNADNPNPNGSNNKNGDGNPTPEPQPSTGIVFENIDASVAELKNGNIELKAGGFPTTAIAADIANTTLVNLANAPADSLKRAFDIVIRKDDVVATSGLVLVGTGDKPNANAFTLDPINKALATYDAADQKEGLRNSAPIAADAANAEAAKAGWNIYGAFMSDTTPTSSTTAASSSRPFSFSPNARGVVTHPVIFCRTTVSTITSGAATGNGIAQDTTVLTGGQRANCYVGATGVAFTGFSANAWLDAAASDTFKKTFDIAVAGIATDAKAIGTLGLPGGAASFRDGLDTAEMTALTTANLSAYKKFSVSIVKDDSFSYTPPPSASIVIENLDASVAELRDGNIQLKAGGFPTTAIAASTVGDITTVRSAPANSIKRAFDIVVKDQAGVDATAGLLFVSTGDKRDSNAFSMTGVEMVQGIGATGSPYTAPQLREGGPLTGLPVTANGANDATKAGWNIYGVFMDNAAPRTAATDAPPFSFTASTHSVAATRPILFCRTTVTTITAAGRVGGIVNTDPGAPRDDTVLTGGQRASCYVGALGEAFTGYAADVWLKKTAGNSFKKAFDIAAAGIKTDAKTLANIGFTGDGKAVLRDGLLTAAQMADLTAANQSGYKKISVSIGRDTGFTYVHSINDDIRINNLYAPGAKVVNQTNILIKFSELANNPLAANSPFYYFIRGIRSIDTNDRRRMFDITNEGTTTGIMLVAKGNIANASDIEVDHVYPHTRISLDPIEDDTLYMLSSGSGSTDSAIPGGWAFIRTFFRKVNPTTTAETASDVEPFSFSRGTRLSKPAFWCISSVPNLGTIGGTNNPDVANGNFAGGNKASCWTGITEGNDQTAWFATAQPFKREITIAVSAINTGNNTVGDLFAGATDVDVLSNFSNGIDATEMASIVTSNPTALRKFNVRIVNDTDFANAP